MIEKKTSLDWSTVVWPWIDRIFVRLCKIHSLSHTPGDRGCDAHNWVQLERVEGQGQV
jgi:hypothetical protein